MSLAIGASIPMGGIGIGKKKKKKNKKARKDFAGARAEAIKRLEDEVNKLPPAMRMGPIGLGLQRQIETLKQTRAEDYAALPDDARARIKAELNQITSAPVAQLYSRALSKTTFGVF